MESILAIREQGCLASPSALLKKDMLLVTHIQNHGLKEVAKKNFRKKAFQEYFFMKRDVDCSAALAYWATLKGNHPFMSSNYV